ncbi:MAG TPA: N-acetylglucosamine-6-phosphate deacetylase [Candidatus Acidoferrales bacterium]|nr:N-acetylglucosamine-6-phosphate deacetylase [Candidatus Acidoferrales bacterium]
MAPLVIYSDHALTPLEEISDAVVVVEGEEIVAAGRRGEVSVPPGAQEHRARGMTLVPGFLDVHIHGAGGHDVMEATEEALRAVTETAAARGTTALLATTVTASEQRIRQSAQGIARFVRSQRGAIPQTRPRAEIVGIHFEGPFISATRRGVHLAEWIAPPSVAALEGYLGAAEGTGRLLTLAPELPGALAVITFASKAGLVVAMGHTDATYREACAAIHQGVRHAAHVFNAMRPFSHRETGVLGAILTSPEVSAELIADGVHVDPPAMRLLLTSKGAERVVLVSDGTAATGMPDGKYQLGTIEVVVTRGVCRNAEGKLAGSTLTLERAVRNIVALGVPLAAAVRMATLNPARLLGLEARKGVLRPGADADLVLLDSDLRVAGVLTRGVGLG